MSRILQYFSFLAIFISCLGLMGLIIHSVMLRIKEIGIRKVLGATLGNLIVLISGGFLKLVLIASVIAAPLAWWVINLWLQNYAYRIEVNGFLFMVIGLIAMAMAFLAVGFQTIKAAISNPVKILRTE